VRGALDPLVVGLAVAVLLAACLGVLWAVGPDDDALDVPLVATAAPVTDTVGSVPDATATDGTAGETGVGDPTTTVPADPTGGTDGTTADATTADGTTTTPEPTTTTGPGDGATTSSEPDDDWPAGRTAWAVILISEERDDHTRAEMEGLRRTARGRGLTNLGLLLSDDYSSLNPGFRVLYQGPFADRDDAARAARAAKAVGYANAYPRRVAP
jgi:hypothetical protein